MSRFSLSRSALAKGHLEPEADTKSYESAPAPPDPVKPEKKEQSLNDQLLEAKLGIHSKIIDELDLSILGELSEDDLRSQIGVFVTREIARERLPLGSQEVKAFADSIVHEMVGLGPLEPLLQDESISDILINGYNQVYVERGGELELSPARFRDNEHLKRIVNKIVSAVGRRVDEGSPLVDARLADGSRVNAAIEPIAIGIP